MTDQYPQPKLDNLIHRLSILIGTATSALEDDTSRAGEWYDEVARQLRRYSMAGFLSGSEVQSLSTDAQRAVREDVATQLDFLRQFKAEIQGADQWQAGWNARAEMYARSIQVPYWRGKTKMLPLPAMPGDGTTACLTNCKCAWSVTELDGDNNYDAYWVYGASERHCQGCIERQSQWSPVRIRNGVLE